MFTPALFGCETPTDSCIAYPWAITYQDMGHRCGYVGVPVGHPCYGMDYYEVYEKYGDIIDVHGGLTYSASTSDNGYPLNTEQPHWWLGFDCGHYVDARDPSIMSDKYKEYFDQEPRLYVTFGEGTIKDDEYVKNEIMALIRQLHEIHSKQFHIGGA